MPSDRCVYLCHRLRYFMFYVRVLPKVLQAASVADTPGLSLVECQARFPEALLQFLSTLPLTQV